VKRVVSQLGGRLFPLPEVGALEAFLARAALAASLWYFYPGAVHHAAQPEPVGLAHWFELTWMYDLERFRWCRLAFLSAVVMYAAGVALPVSATAAAVLHVLPWTLHNSQGFTFHGHQVASLTLIAQSLTLWWLAVRGRAGWGQPSAWANRWLLFNSQFAVAASYFVSVCAKLWISGGEWFANSRFIVLDLVKTSRQHFMNHLDPAASGDPPLLGWFTDHPLAAAVLFSSGVVCEALLFLSTGTRRPALVLGLALVLMHRCVGALMGLHFWSHELLLLIYFVNVPFLVAALVGRLRGRHGAPPAGATAPGLQRGSQPQR
jgi:hypothetical protein